MERKTRSFKVAEETWTALKSLSGKYDRTMQDIVAALVDLLDFTETMDSDPQFVKKFRIYFETCLLNVGIEAYFEGEREKEEDQLQRIVLTRQAIRKLRDRREKETK